MGEGEPGEEGGVDHEEGLGDHEEAVAVDHVCDGAGEEAEEEDGYLQGEV